MSLTQAAYGGQSLRGSKPTRRRALIGRRQRLRVCGARCRRRRERLEKRWRSGERRCDRCWKKGRVGLAERRCREEKAGRWERRLPGFRRRYTEGGSKGRRASGGLRRIYAPARSRR